MYGEYPYQQRFRSQKYDCSFGDILNYRCSRIESSHVQGSVTLSTVDGGLLESLDSLGAEFGTS